MVDEFPEDHPPQFVGHGSHYTFLLDFGPGVDTRAVVHKLLRTKLGIVAGSLDRNEPRFNGDLKASMHNQRKAQSLDDFITEMQKDTPSLLRLIQINPYIAIRVLLIFLRSKLPRIQRDASEVSTGWATDLSEMMKSVVTDTDQQIIDQTKLLGGRLDMERQLHSAAYRFADPYLRVSLQRMFFKSRSGGSTWDGAIEVSLMLHRTGVCVVTMSVDGAETLDFTQAQRLMLPTWVEFDSAEVSKSIADYNLGRYARLRSRKQWQNAEVAESQKWITLRRDDELGAPNLTYLFEIYLAAVCRAGGVDCPSWQSFSTLSLGPLTCGCDETNFEEVHSRSLVSLLRGTSVDVNYREDIYTSHLRNLLPIEDGTLYVSSGKAILIDHGSAEPSFMNSLRRSVVGIESALSQHGQLLQADRLTTDAVVRDRNLFDAQRVLTNGLLEYHRNVYSTDDIPVIVEALHDRMGTQKLYSRLHDRVSTMNTLVTSRYSRIQNRRSLLVSVSGLALVLILLMPRLSETLRAFVNAGGYPASAIQQVDEWTGGRGATTLVIYLSIASICVLALATVSVRWGYRRLFRRRRFGHSTKGRFEIRAVMEGDQPPDHIGINVSKPECRAPK